MKQLAYAVAELTKEVKSLKRKASIEAVPRVEKKTIPEDVSSSSESSEDRIEKSIPTTVDLSDITDTDPSSRIPIQLRTPTHSPIQLRTSSTQLTHVNTQLRGSLSVQSRNSVNSISSPEIDFLDEVCEVNDIILVRLSLFSLNPKFQGRSSGRVELL